MTDSTKSLQALEEFIVLGKSAPGAAAVANIQKCISAPNCFVFAELLELPNVQALSQDPEHVKWIEVLKLFAYGSYMDYKKQKSTTPTSLPDLTPPQLTKLKQLSLVTIASTEPSSLTYTTLQSLLDIPNTRLLEDLIISAIYASLLDAKLDTAAQRVEVSSTAGRDVAPGDITQMITALTAWSSQCDGVLAEIESQIRDIQNNALKSKKEALEYDRIVEDRKKHALTNPDNKEPKDGLGGLAAAAANVAGMGGGGGLGKGKRSVERDGFTGYGAGGDDEMDLDDGPFDDHGGARKNRRHNPLYRRKR